MLSKDLDAIAVEFPPFALPPTPWTLCLDSTKICTEMATTEAPPRFGQPLHASAARSRSRSPTATSRSLIIQSCLSFSSCAHCGGTLKRSALTVVTCDILGASFPLSCPSPSACFPRPRPPPSSRNSLSLPKPPPSPAATGRLHPDEGDRDGHLVCSE